MLCRREVGRKTLGTRAVAGSLCRITVLITMVALWADHSAAQIIDMHFHAFGFDEYGFPPPPNEVSGEIPSYDSQASFMSAAVKELRAAGVVRVVASGPMRHVERWARQSEVAVHGGAYTGSRDPLPTPEELRALVASGTVEVLGELGLQYRGLAPNSPEMQPFWALAEELELPVGVHTGLGDAGTTYGCCPDFRARLGNPLLLEDVLVAHPKLRPYLMHAGYPFLAETKALLTIYPQVYVDTGVINWAVPRAEFHDYLHSLVRAGFADRIMFGSDQMVWPAAIGMAVEGIETADFLTEPQKRAIYYDNAARFLRLTPEQMDRDRRVAVRGQAQ